MNPPPPRIAIAAIFRNEHPYVLEWIAHHRALGVERFYIADNISDDGTSELLQALHDLGVIRRIPFTSTPGQAPQLPAYAELLGTHARDEDWIAVIDADEFIMPTGGARSLAEALAPLMAQADVGAVVLNWAIFGSAWLLNHSAGLVCERFTRRAHPSFGANHHYKTVLRRAAFASVYSNPHHFVLQPGWRCVHTDGSDVVLHPRHGTGLSERVVWDGLRLNHYIVKSREEFETRKARNGSAATVGRVKGEDYFVGHDRNECRDGLTAERLAATRTELLALQRHLSCHGHPVPAAPGAAPAYCAPFVGTRGCIDRIEWREGKLVLSGWSFQGSGQITPCLSVRVGDQVQTFSGYPTRPRPDVQHQYPMAPLECGFMLSVDTQDPRSVDEILQVQGQTDWGNLGEPFSMPARK
jgi:Glycosyl transferase family 2